jgi:hypothetical protein
VRGRRLGVRWNRAGLDAELRALAAGALGAQDAPANVSIVLGERTGRQRSKHQIHVQGRLLGTTTSDGGVIRAVIRALGALAGGSAPGTLSLDAFLVVDSNGRAVAVDRRLAADMQRLGPRLGRGGGHIVHLPHLEVRPHSGTAVLPDGAAGAGISLEALETRWPLEPGDDDLASGEVPLAAFLYAGRPDPESPAHAVAEMVPMLRDPTGRVDRSDVAALAALVTNVVVEAGVLRLA